MIRMDSSDEEANWLRKKVLWIVGGVVGLLGVLWEAVLGVFSGLFGVLWADLVWVVGSVFGFLSRQAIWLFGVRFGVLGGEWLYVALFGVAVVLRMLGVENVYSVLNQTVERADRSEAGTVKRVREVPAEKVTTDDGQFSAEEFEATTGLTPPEFVHLYVQSNGGCVEQTTINDCLPWSKATVSRVLDTLEDDDLVRRIKMGRVNIVCTPDAAPGGGGELNASGGGSAKASQD